MTDPRKHSTPLVELREGAGRPPVPYHRLDAISRGAIPRRASRWQPGKSRGGAETGIASGVIEAVDLRVFRWGDRAQYNLPGAEPSGVEVGPLPLSPVHKAHWGRVIRKALANENRLITPGEENLEDLADEFVRLETSNGVILTGKISKPAPTSGAA